MQNVNLEGVKSKIHTIRGQQVMLDFDLSGLYEVSVKRINEQVKRNIERFPNNFMYQLTDEEYGILRSHFATSSDKHGGRRYLPYAFTEQGVAMLSGVLKSAVAINVSIQIMNAFVAMRRFFAANGQAFYRLDSIEKRQLEHDRKFEQVFTAIENRILKPQKGIFFEGQVFDAYKFVSDLVRSAKISIILIDNYVDDSVLTLFCKRYVNVTVCIYTKEISKQLSLDLKKYNSQYPAIEVVEFPLSHDRFLIIDDEEVYHIGASLKDLGKRWFAFSRFDKEAVKMLNKLDRSS